MRNNTTQQQSTGLAICHFSLVKFLFIRLSTLSPKERVKKKCQEEGENEINTGIILIHHFFFKKEDHQVKDV